MADTVARESLCCPQCGFGLTGLPDDHRCPECGFGYQREAILTLVRNELAARRGLAELVILFAAAATLLSLLPLSAKADPSLLARGGLVRIGGILVIAAVAMIRVFRDPENEALYWQARAAMIGMGLLAVLSALAPDFVLGLAGVCLFGALMTMLLHNPAYPSLAASIPATTKRSLRRLEVTGYASTAIAGASLIAALAR